MAFSISIKGIDSTIKALQAEAKQLSDHRAFLRDEVAPLLDVNLERYIVVVGMVNGRRLHQAQ